jgi:hypothetical protein
MIQWVRFSPDPERRLMKVKNCETHTSDVTKHSEKKTCLLGKASTRYLLPHNDLKFARRRNELRKSGAFAQSTQWISKQRLKIVQDKEMFLIEIQL